MPHCPARARQQRFDLALRLLVGGQRLFALLPWRPARRPAWLAAGSGSAFAAALAPASSICRRNAVSAASRLPARRDRTPPASALAHLRRQFGGPGVGLQRIAGIVEQRTAPPAGANSHLAAVELAVRALPYALAQQCLAFARCPPASSSTVRRDRLDVGLEGLAGPMVGAAFDAIRERTPGLRKTQAQPVLEIMNAPCSRAARARADLRRRDERRRRSVRQERTGDGQQ